MTDFSSLAGKFRVQKNSSQGPVVAKTTKRVRESLVCHPCRKSKLRCDKCRPCGNCSKRNETELCKYDRPLEREDGASRYSAAEERLLHLESMVKYLIQDQARSTPSTQNALTETEPPTTYSSYSNDLIDQTQPEPSDDTQYVGSTHWSAILDDVHELKAALAEAASTPSSDEGRMVAKPDLGDEVIFGSSTGLTLQYILNKYLPSKVEIDRLLAIYFRGETFLVPFVHTYYFQRQYRKFWIDVTKVKPLWLSILFSICCMGSITGETLAQHSSPQDGTSDIHSQLHTAAGLCLVLGQYHKAQQDGPEALAMYVLCKIQRNLDPSREAGAALGIVVRIAYEMGYHRDPIKFGKFTVFEAEMRRRFWAVCKQLDLMTTFQLGLPSNIRFENCDTEDPRNLLDTDFDENTTVLPESRSENEATNLLWFIVKSRQMVSFSKVCQDALSFKEKSEAEIAELDEEIRQMYLTIPDVLRARPLAESFADPPFLVMTRTYVEFIHLKSLCVLHRKYMARGRDFSTRSCVDAARKLVERVLDLFREMVPGGQLSSERWMMNNFTMNDFHMGVMILCLVVHIRRKRGGQGSSVDSDTEHEIVKLLEQSLIVCTEKSSLSRDAMRVSHAIRLTLKGSNISHMHGMSPAPPIRMSVPGLSTCATLDDGVQELDTRLVSSQPQYDDTYGDEAAFGPLDPFNFIPGDVDMIDWTMFDTELGDHNL